LLVREIGFGCGKPIIIAAHDMGAPPSLIWAADHPTEIAGLLYVEAPVMLGGLLREIISYTPEAMREGSMWWWILPLAPDAKVARPNTDQTLPHIGLVGDTYTILLSGEDTNGRYCLIDMHVPPSGGPAPHRHDFEESFSVLDGEIEVTFRGNKSVMRAGETVSIPAIPSTPLPTRRNSLLDCFAYTRGDRIRRTDLKAECLPRPPPVPTPCCMSREY
jgi:quercetin dioxygenase-like cupin family protein